MAHLTSFFSIFISASLLFSSSSSLAEEEKEEGLKSSQITKAQSDHSIYFNHDGSGLGKSERTYLNEDFKKEIASENSEDADENLTFRALNRAIEWTKRQMSPDWGWGPDTPHTVLALSIADSAWFASNALETKLIAKQFDLQLVLRLWKHRVSPITTGQLALNVMALVALCRDPRDFNEKDLVALLEHREGEVDFEIAFSCLASCNAGRHIRKFRMRRILDIISDTSKIHSLDTISIGVLAIRCAEGQRGSKMKEYLIAAIETLLNQQKPDGSFASNLHSTAIALQAMMATGLGESWNATRAQQYVMSHQQEDGSFGNLFDTNAVLPLLAGKTLLDIGEKFCPMGPDMDVDQVENQVDALTLSSEPPPVPISTVRFKKDSLASSITTPPKQVEMINMTYFIWVGDKPSIAFNISLTVPKKTHFFDIMQMAAERDSNFEFTASKWAHGYYIHTLAGQKEKQTGFWFWLLYRLREPPVLGIRPDNKYVVADGVLELVPNDGDYILFWYHKI